MSDCRRYRVSGRVQGVFYRASAQAQGQALGLSGWVRNLPDGDVEAVACGAEPQLEAFERWLAQGPPHAVVDLVQTRVAHPEETASIATSDFEIKRTLI
ncbi:MAG: acylphosphatase [Gammaproteobacteria bacterium]|jgi:acylphosphatase